MLPDTKVGGQVVEGLLPKAVLHPVGEQHHAELEQRVVGMHAGLYLGDLLLPKPVRAL